MRYQICRIEQETRSKEQGVRNREQRAVEWWSGAAVERWKCRLALFPRGLWSLRLFPERVVSAYGIAETSIVLGDLKFAKYKPHFCRRIAFIKQTEHR
ncbi:MAG: hypothetical protein OEW82_08565 [Dehalococcoidia bacterium]|nr:hypothetical protein [Dehalococcoidia bacterium]